LPPVLPACGGGSSVRTGTGTRIVLWQFRGRPSRAKTNILFFVSAGPNKGSFPGNLPWLRAWRSPPGPGPLALPPRGTRPPWGGWKLIEGSHGRRGVEKTGKPGGPGERAPRDWAPPGLYPGEGGAVRGGETGPGVGRACRPRGAFGLRGTPRAIPGAGRPGGRPGPRNHRVGARGVPGRAGPGPERPVETFACWEARGRPVAGPPGGRRPGCTGGVAALVRWRPAARSLPITGLSDTWRVQGRKTRHHSPRPVILQVRLWGVPPPHVKPLRGL